MTKQKATNIVWHPGAVTRADREQLNGHRGCTVWLTGLSGSGKSTIAVALEKELWTRDVRAYILDGDNIRHGLNKNLGFSPTDRTENIRRIGEVAKLFTDAGMVALTAFISPYRADRDQVRAIMQPGDFIEVFVDCPVETCEARHGGRPGVDVDGHDVEAVEVELADLGEGARDDGQETDDRGRQLAEDRVHADRPGHDLRREVRRARRRLEALGRDDDPVQVGRQPDDVVDAVVRDEVQELVALRRPRLPAVIGDEDELGDRRAVHDELEGRGRIHQAALEPRLLRRAE